MQPACAAEPHLCFLVVNYMTPDVCLRCVTSILEHGLAVPKDILVVDNGSSVPLYQRLLDSLPADIQLMRNHINGGFAMGINFGARHADGDVLLILNPDTYFVDRSLMSSLRLLMSSDVNGIVGLGLLHPDGRPQYSGRRFYTYLDIAIRRLPIGNLWPFSLSSRRHLMIDSWHKGAPFETDWVMGTGFLIKKSVFDALGGMDESYFMYMEDVDLCARAWRAGYRVLCCPEARLVHDHQRASKTNVFGKPGREHLRSLMIFRRKYAVPLVVLPRAHCPARAVPFTLARLRGNRRTAPWR